jgi:hypothetical protein
MSLCVKPPTTIALQRGRAQLLVQMAQPGSVAQQVLQDRHGDVVPKEDGQSELGAVAHGRQEGSELGIPEPSDLQDQGL